MSEANVDLARKAFEAFAARDVDAALAVMDEGVEFLPVTANLTTGGVPYRGHDGIRSYLEDVAGHPVRAVAPAEEQPRPGLVAEPEVVDLPDDRVPPLTQGELRLRDARGHQSGREDQDQRQ